MRFQNYDTVLRNAPRPRPFPEDDRTRIHKDAAPPAPRVSFILLDWGVRERFNTLDWLLRQDVPKSEYELIWIELFDRVVPEVLEKADVVVTCHQERTYHKHQGYNVGLLKARGEVVTVCDSDAVFPRDFVSSIYRSFVMESGKAPIPLVLMHYEWRTGFLYPERLDDAEELKDPKWDWWPLVNNAGACMSVRRADAIRFGGFDEDESYHGYICGPYELGWRLVNAGIPEVWHDESVALWHFAHPDPIGSNGVLPRLGQLLENKYPHVDMHAIRAVEAFSSGRMQPLQENPEIWRLRMAERRIGSGLEARYAIMTGPTGFSPWQIRRMRLAHFVSRPRHVARVYLTWLYRTAVQPHVVRARAYVGRKLRVPARALRAAILRRMNTPEGRALKERLKRVLGMPRYERVYRLLHRARLI